MRDAFDSLKKRLSELVVALERGDVDERQLEGVLYSVRVEFERVQSNALGLVSTDAAERERREAKAADVQRLVAVALDLAARRKDQIAAELERTRRAASRMRYYGAPTDVGGSCDLDG